MQRFEITVSTPGAGKVKHVIRQPTKDKAIAKVRKAYPHAMAIKAKRLPDAVKPFFPETAHQNSKEARMNRRKRYIAEMFDAIPPGGLETRELAEKIGRSAQAVRVWARELEEQGKVVREVISKQGALRIRRAEG